MKKRFQFLKTVAPITILVAVLTGLAIGQANDVKPVKALMITGEGYHDYESQKGIISEGISERMAVDWTIHHHKTADEAKTALSKEGWAEGYDVVLYNICHAKETDAAFIEKLVQVHEAGVPVVALHCTMHSYHWKVEADGDKPKPWNRLMGVSSKNHGPKAPITVKKVEANKDHPILKDLPDGWTTPEGELYNVNKIISADVLAFGTNGKAAEPQAVIWTNKAGKAKVFATTIGHHNSTMKTKEYLDLLTNGIKWVIAEDKE